MCPFSCSNCRAHHGGAKAGATKARGAAAAAGSGKRKRGRPRAGSDDGSDLDFDEDQTESEPDLDMGMEDGSDEGEIPGARKRKRLRGSGGGGGAVGPEATGPRAELNFRLGEVVKAMKDYQAGKATGSNVFYGPVTVHSAPDYYEIVPMEDHMYIQKMEQKVGGGGDGLGVLWWLLFMHGLESTCCDVMRLPCMIGWC